jgi:hypothetical protein
MVINRVVRGFSEGAVILLQFRDVALSLVEWWN